MLGFPREMIRQNPLYWHAACNSYGDGEISHRPITKTQ